MVRKRMANEKEPPDYLLHKGFHDLSHTDREMTLIAETLKKLAKDARALGITLAPISEWAVFAHKFDEGEMLDQFASFTPQMLESDVHNTRELDGKLRSSGVLQRQALCREFTTRLATDPTARCVSKFWARCTDWTQTQEFWARTEARLRR